MRVSFLVLLLYLSVTASGATYYIDPAGSDSNNGSAGSPWKNLAYACSKVKTAGDIIHVNSGNYTETAQSLLAVGVSIEGDGVSSNILSNVSKASTFTILLSSSTVATDGSQHISNIKMDGNSLAAYGAIQVAYRKNVEIYNCTFINFNYYGVSFINGEPPSVYATGNKFHDNTVTNCSGYFSGNRGALEIQGQDGMLIYNNTMTQNRSNGLNGDIIYAVEGYLKNVKIYNNVMTKTYVPGKTNWDFALELWSCLGGVEIYDNEITGSVDLVNSSKTTSSYSVWVHNNRIGQPTILSSESVRGILLEANQSDVIIERNKISNVAAGIYLDQLGSAQKIINIYINANIFTDIGVSDAGANSKGWGIVWTAETYKNHTVSNINICNNVIAGHTGSRTTMWGLNLPHEGTAKNITVRNNIIRDFDYAPIYAYTQTGAETIDILSIENNIFYLNGNNNLPKYSGITPTNNTTRNNIAANPLFISSTDFHLQAGSPGIGAGIKIAGLTLDFDGNTYNDPPSIGAYENDVPTVPVYQSSVIENATPAILDMTYNLSLANIVPAVSAFSVTVNSVARTINSVAVSGNKVRLTLAGDVVNGDIVAVSYTVPSANPLQTAGGELAATISGKRVTNNVSPVTPVFVSAVVENAAPSIVVMTYNMTLANIKPATSAFSVNVNSSARSVSSVVVSGTSVQLTLSSPVVNGDVVTAAYTKPSANPLQAASGAQAVTISAQKVTNNVSPGSPVYVSSVVENAQPSNLVMTYNMNLANVVPAASAFSVRVNSTARSVSSVAVSGATVKLTLSAPVVFGDAITIAYTKPSGNPLQSTTGTQVATMSAQKVTNNVSSLIPVYVSSSVENGNTALLVMTYNMTLTNVIPAVSAFTVRVNSSTRSVSSVAVSGTNVLLTLSSPVVFGDAITIAYAKPATNPLQNASGGQAASLSAQKVTNNINPVYPVYVYSSIESSTPSILEITYSLGLANVIPSASAFKVNVNSSARSVSKVAVTGSKVLLTLSSPVVYGDVITVAYTKPSSRQLKSTSGMQVATMSAQTVQNNTVNSAPTVAIISPLNNSEFGDPANITITADAIDPDGSIKLVEFYNGNTKIGSSSSAPFSLDWNNIGPGSYTLTAVATDNYNLTAVSPAILISVIDSADVANQPPVVLISNPLKGDKYLESDNVEIDVIASDPDGTITKVAIYNGSTMLAELTSPPFTYIWKGVKAGTYNISAIATDNSNSTTTSPSVEFIIGNVVKYDANSDFINLYPNPSDGHFTIDVITPLENEKSEIIITDLAGKQFYRGPLLREETSKQFDLSDIKSGIYIMSIIDKEILITKKIIKR